MLYTNNKLLYEALELRAEYDARTKTLKDYLPETKQNRNRLSFLGDKEEIYRPSADFNIGICQSSLDIFRV